MSDPTSVNRQIIDSVTQPNVKVIGEAPAIAIGSLYQAIANSISVAIQDAVYAQQQANMVALAATSQAIMQLYSLDSTTTAVAGTSASAQDATPVQSQFEQSTDALKSTASPAQSSIHPQIEAAVKLANESALANAGEFAYALRVASDAAVAVIDDTGRATQRHMMRILQSAAVAACMKAMLEHPEKADEYAKVMQTIRDFS
jgi:hypothetical protein